jgi:tetratricopeptide (TPR) repeat protein
VLPLEPWFLRHLPESIPLTAERLSRVAAYLIAGLIGSTTILVSMAAHSQVTASGAKFQATVQGYVRDSSGSPVANATVLLKLSIGKESSTGPAQATQTQTAQTNLEGGYRFDAVSSGAYSLRAQKTGYAEASVNPISIVSNETKSVNLTLIVAKDSRTRAPEYFDEPQFTVAGVTEATNAGGHGSDTVLRATEALAKATVSLSNDTAESPGPETFSATETSLRNAVTRAPEDFDANRLLGEFLVSNGKTAEAVQYLEHASRLKPTDADVHHVLASADEKSAHPLDAVREYQRAAELDPSETNLFDWGTELLTHRALEPATEVFGEGNHLFPASVRMLVALGVSWYARGAYDQAIQCLVRASDLAPDNPTPYQFLGKIQGVSVAPSEESTARLARFAQLQPENALANYYYAVALWKQSANVANGGHDAQPDAAHTEHVESLLQTAVRLDSNLGEAYLQLGILYSQREDFSHAIAEYQKAIAVSSGQDDTLAEAHYRLAKVYMRTGAKSKAQVELKLHADLDRKIKTSVDRERRDVQQFVVSIDGADPVSRPQP